MKKLQVLLVDDQKLLTDSLKRVLESEEDVGTVRIAAGGEEAIAEIQRCSYDIVLMDIHMPNMTGIEATRIMHQKDPKLKIIMLTTFGYDEWIKAAMENGAVGYLLKDISSSELIAAIRGANTGMRVVSPGVMEAVSLVPSAEKTAASVPNWFRQLSDHERDILVLVMKGYSNEEIASRIHLSTQTIKNYLSLIYDKLNVNNRFQAMRLAIEQKLDSLWIVSV